MKQSHPVLRNVLTLISKKHIISSLRFIVWELMKTQTKLNRLEKQMAHKKKPHMKEKHREEEGHEPHQHASHKISHKERAIGHKAHKMHHKGHSRGK